MHLSCLTSICVSFPLDIMSLGWHESTLGIPSSRWASECMEYKGFQRGTSCSMPNDESKSLENIGCDNDLREVSELETVGVLESTVAC